MDPHIRDNFYLLLGLSLEKEETDIGVIKAVIDAKMKEWSKRENNDPECRRYRAWFAQGKSGWVTILDAEERQKLFRAAKEHVDKELPDIIDLRNEKGYLSGDDLKEIAKYIGIAEAEVRRKLPQLRPNAVVNDEPKEGEVKLPKWFKYDEFVNWAELLMKAKVSSLYEFPKLELANKENPDPRTILTAIEARRKKLDLNRNKTPEEEAEKSALDKAAPYFQDEATKAEYDRMDPLIRYYAELKNAIDRCDKQKPVSAEYYQHIQRMVAGMNVSRDLALGFVWAYAQKNSRRILQAQVPLFPCPKCHVQNPITKRCQCGVNMTDATRFKRNMDGAALAMARGDWVDAQKWLNNVAGTLRDLPEYVAAQNRYNVARKKADDAADKRQRDSDLAATSAAAAFRQSEYDKADGFLIQLAAIDKDHPTLTDLRPKVRAKINEAETEATRIEKITSKTDQEREWIRFARSFPHHPHANALPVPQPPAEVKATVMESSIALSWKASPSPEISDYLVLRRNGGEPTYTVNDGWKLESKSCQAADVGPPPGQNLHYAVYARRGDKMSSPAHGQSAVLLTSKIEEAHAGPGDKQITLSWKMAKGSKGTRIEKLEAGKWITLASKSMNQVTHIDDKVTNGQTYRYRLRGIYLDTSGRELPSSETELPPVTPAEPPKAVVDLTAERINNESIVLTWTVPATGTRFALLAADHPPNNTKENTLAWADALALGKAISGLDSYSGRAEYHEKFTKCKFFIPITERNGIAVIGRTCQAMPFVPGVWNLKAKRAGDDLHVTWEWPDGCQECLVCYRVDRYPESPNDAGANKATVTQAAYRQEGVHVIRRVGGHDYYFAVFAYCKEPQGSAWSSPAYELFVGAQTTITYTLKKTGRLVFFRGGRKLAIRIADGSANLPPLVLVQQTGRQPLSRKDGQEVVKIDTNGKREHMVPLPKGCKSGLYVRLFVDRAEDERRYKILNPTDMRV